MRMRYNKDKKTFEFGYEFIDAYVTRHFNSSGWNETQLKLIVETLVNVIDTVTEKMMQNNCIGTAVWVLEQLFKLNDYMKDKIYQVELRDHPDFMKVHRPLVNFRRLIYNYQYQPRWLADLSPLLTQPQLLCVGKFFELGLEPLQKGIITSEQHVEEHAIVAEVLAIAIERLKQSKAYQKAEREGRLYYPVRRNLPLTLYKEVQDPQPHVLPSPPVIASHAPHFFKSPAPKPKSRKRKLAELEAEQTTASTSSSPASRRK